MKELITESTFFGVAISLLCFELGVLIKKRVPLAIANPLLIGAILVIGFLVVFKIDYEVYAETARYIDYFLTPATIALAVPLYKQLHYLKKYPLAIFGGIFSGVMTSMVSIYLLALAFGLNHEQYVTFLPKSITTAIGLGVSEKMGGIVPLTIVTICITGIFGNIAAELILKLFRIKNPVAKGLAIGTAAHAMGTAKAMEIGEVEGAMSSLSIVITGIMTVAAVAVFSMLI